MTLYGNWSWVLWPSVLSLQEYVSPPLPPATISSALSESSWPAGGTYGTTTYIVSAVSSTALTVMLSGILVPRSEERRVGKECRSRLPQHDEKRAKFVRR